MKDFREKTFLRIPSMVHVSEVRLIVASGIPELSGEASLNAGHVHSPGLDQR